MRSSLRVWWQAAVEVADEAFAEGGEGLVVQVAGIAPVIVEGAARV
ncbi:hypothetical protein [Rhodococcus oxybenzonivorans]